MRNVPPTGRDICPSGDAQQKPPRRVSVPGDIAIRSARAKLCQRRVADSPNSAIRAAGTLIRCAGFGGIGELQPRAVGARLETTSASASGPPSRNGTAAPDVPAPVIATTAGRSRFSCRQIALPAHRALHPTVLASHSLRQHPHLASRSYRVSRFYRLYQIESNASRPAVGVIPAIFLKGFLFKRDSFASGDPSAAGAATGGTGIAPSRAMSAAAAPHDMRIYTAAGPFALI